jgi:hypothetical protein
LQLLSECTQLLLVGAKPLLQLLSPELFLFQGSLGRLQSLGLLLPRYLSGFHPDLTAMTQFQAGLTHPRKQVLQTQGRFGPTAPQGEQGQE